MGATEEQLSSSALASKSDVAATSRTQRSIPLLGRIFLSFFGVAGVVLVIWGATDWSHDGWIGVLIGMGILALPVWILVLRFNDRKARAAYLLRPPTARRRFGVVFFSSQRIPGDHSNRYEREGVLFDVERDECVAGRFKFVVGEGDELRHPLKKVSMHSECTVKKRSGSQLELEIALKQYPGSDYHIGSVTLHGMEAFSPNPEAYNEFNTPKFELVADDDLVTVHCARILPREELHRKLRMIGEIVKTIPEHTVHCILNILPMSPPMPPDPGSLASPTVIGYAAGSAMGGFGLAGAVVGTVVGRAMRPTLPSAEANREEIRGMIYGSSESVGADNLRRIADSFGWTIRAPEGLLEEAQKH